MEVFFDPTKADPASAFALPWSAAGRANEIGAPKSFGRVTPLHGKLRTGGVHPSLGILALSPSNPMPKHIAPVVFNATGMVQAYVVLATGRYEIEASGAQGGAGGGPGGKGARVKGTFELKAGEILQIVVGQQGTPGTTPHQPAGGGGGGSFVWKGDVARPLPTRPLLAAGGGGGGNGGDGVVTLDAADGAARGGKDGRGGAADLVDFHYSGGGGTGWVTGGAFGSAPTYCRGGGHWFGGAGANYCSNEGGRGGFGGGGGGAFVGHGSGGGGGYSGGGGGTQAGLGGGGGGSYNAGANPTNTPGVQTGDGCVSIVAVPAPVSFRASDRTLVYDLRPVEIDAVDPVGRQAVTSDGAPVFESRQMNAPRA